MKNFQIVTYTGLTSADTRPWWSSPQNSTAFLTPGSPLHWFEGIIVSGTEKTRKPFKEIYQLTLDRFHISAENSIFIDDNLRNIKAAEALGINGIHFESPNALLDQLRTFSITI